MVDEEEEEAEEDEQIDEAFEMLFMTVFGLQAASAGISAEANIKAKIWGGACSEKGELCDMMKSYWICWMNEKLMKKKKKK